MSSNDDQYYTVNTYPYWDIYYYVQNGRNRWLINLIPRSPGYPIIGNILQYLVYEAS